MRHLLITLLAFVTTVPAAEPIAPDLIEHDQRLEAMAEAVAPLPVLHEGRIKPFDTVARHYLMLLTEGQQTIPATETTPIGLSASAWMLEAMSDREAAYPRPALRIRAYEVADWLGLPRRTPAEVDDRNMAWRHSLEELHAPLNANWSRIQDISMKEPEHRGRVEVQLLNLVQAVTEFLDASSSELRLIPGLPDQRVEWQTPGQVVQARSDDELQRTVLRSWLDLLSAAAEDEPERVAQAAGSIAAATAPLLSEKRLTTEVWFNTSNLFADSMVFYILALVLVLLGLAMAPKFFTISALSLMGVGLLFHTVGIGIRVYIMERPPVATLYETVIFAGWVGV
ncbi:MAG: hypothetical protein ACOCXA_02765, partial [Planctomycetota bacterium]